MKKSRKKLKKSRKKLKFYIFSFLLIIVLFLITPKFLGFVSFSSLTIQNSEKGKQSLPELKYPSDLREYPYYTKKLAEKFNILQSQPEDESYFFIKSYYTQIHNSPNEEAYFQEICLDSITISQMDSSGNINNNSLWWRNSECYNLEFASPISSGSYGGFIVPKCKAKDNGNPYVEGRVIGLYGGTQWVYLLNSTFLYNDYSDYSNGQLISKQLRDNLYEKFYQYCADNGYYTFRCQNGVFYEDFHECSSEQVCVDNLGLGDGPTCVDCEFIGNVCELRDLEGSCIECYAYYNDCPAKLISPSQCNVYIPSSMNKLFIISKGFNKFFR